MVIWTVDNVLQYKIWIGLYCINMYSRLCITVGLFSWNFNIMYVTIQLFLWLNIYSLSDVVIAQLMNVLPSACRPSFVPQSHKNVTIKGLVRKILIYHLHKKSNYQHQWKTKNNIGYYIYDKKNLVNLTSKRCYQIKQ